jgi:hypothetical protein
MPEHGEFITSYAREALGHEAERPARDQQPPLESKGTGLQITMLPVHDLNPYAKNPRNNEPAVDAVAASIREFGFKVPIILDRNREIIAGHTRLKAAKKLGLKEVPCIIADDLTPEQIRAFRLADNKVAELASWDGAMLREELLTLADLGFDMKDFGFSSVDTWEKRNASSLSDKYIVPPFSVLDSRQEYWQERKTEWEAQIGQSESIDPALCEVIYKWFCPESGTVFSPFAGVGPAENVAAALGLEFADREQATEGQRFDFGIIVPPLEVIKKLDAEKYAVYFQEYRQAISETIGKLKDNAFIVAVVSDLWGLCGYMYDFTGDTKKAATQAGCKLLNDIIFVENASIDADQATKRFNDGRHLTQTSQNILVFVKGDEKNIPLVRYNLDEAEEGNE